MPLDPRASQGDIIREVHKGKTYERTKRRYGKRAADKQAVAISYSVKRRSKRHGKRKSRR